MENENIKIKYTDVDSIFSNNDNVLISDYFGNILKYDEKEDDFDKIISANEIESALPDPCRLLGGQYRVGNLILHKNAVYGILHGLNRNGYIIKVDLNSKDIDLIETNQYSTMVFSILDDSIYFSAKGNLYKTEDEVVELVQNDIYRFSIIDSEIYCFSEYNNRTRLFKLSNNETIEID